MKLISMVDFVLEQDKKWEKQNIANSDMLNNIVNYANFLKQPLELWMFVPCDEKGNVLEIPEMINNVGAFGVYNGVFQNKNEYIKQYLQAKETCMFEGLDIDAVNHHIYQKRNVEYLANFGTLQLTQTAIKQLGL